MSPIQRTPETLEDAMHEVVFRSSRPAKALADAIGARYTYLVDAVNPNRDGFNFQLRWVAPITLASGNDAIVRYLAHAVGGMFVRLQPAGVAMDAQTAQVLKETAEYLTAVAETTADGKVTRAEADTVEREARQAIEALLAHVEAVKARVVDDAPKDDRPGGFRMVR